MAAYDKNGNIKGLQRYGQTSASAYGLIDNLAFTLDGNRLNRVDDAATASAYGNGFEFKDGAKQADEYAYDANGNLTKDLNAGISDIQYNCLNLPLRIDFSAGGFAQYGYTMDGVKRRKQYMPEPDSRSPVTIAYCGNVVYEESKARFLLTDEGYVTLEDNKYHYYLKDHQGNNCVVIDQSGTVEETNHYYPFGGVFASTGNVQPYKYNGKEVNARKELNWYDYGARLYDAAMGRFTTVDPLAEKYYEMNPYGYCANNPIRFIDKNGMEFGPGDLFKTPREAAKDWGMYYNGASILRKREMSSFIYEVKKGEKMVGYSYSPAKMGKKHEAYLNVSPEGITTVATIHSHGDYDGIIVEGGKSKQVKDNTFSSADKAYNKRSGTIGYLTTPSGTLLEHEPNQDKIEILSKDLPSDPKDPNRQNQVRPKEAPATKSTVATIIDWLKNLF